MKQSSSKDSDNFPNQSEASNIPLPDMMYGWRVTCVQKRLEQLGKAQGSLTVEDLTALGHLDQYHYYETQACDEAIEILKLQPDDHVLDIGSGIGGPARYISDKTQARFTCVEIQEELNVMARILTERVGLEEKIQYNTGDFMRLEIEDSTYEVFLSYLVFLHMPDKQMIFERCNKVLKPGGRFLIEDLVKIGDFEKNEKDKLEQVISAKEIVEKQQYLNMLTKAGFVELEIEDLTRPWTTWCNQRYEKFITDDNNPVLYGDTIFASRKHFYCTVRDLFNGGNLGGIRVTGKKSK